MQSALQHPEIIDDYLQKELLQEQIRGPFPAHVASLSTHKPFWYHPKKR